jgi:outer membrane protein assembly factor BamD (BamD/ComL family)
MEKTAGEMYDKAYAEVQAGNMSSANKILRKLRKELSPQSAYYLRVLALIDDAKEGGESED